MFSSQLSHVLGVCLAELRGECQVRVYILGVGFLSIFYLLSRAFAQRQQITLCCGDVEGWWVLQSRGIAGWRDGVMASTDHAPFRSF